MRSLQDYIDIYSTIARNLNFQGDSVEVLTQMLANASYISEVENIAYVQEASLEKATLINSKIQHCMNDMYSVYRGSCPRVIIKFKPTKYFSFNVFDEIVSSNSFKVYYLGYYSGDSATTSSSVGMQTVSNVAGFIYSPVTIPPAINDTDTYTIVGLLAKETVNQTWSLDQSNTYYVNCLEEDLSSDLWVKVNDNYFDVTREFSDHILNGDIFDLTLPSFGSRLYVADIFKNSATLQRTETQTPANTKIEATYFKYSTLDSYNESELRKISIKGGELVSLDQDFLDRGYTELSTGITCLSEVGRDDVTTIHYKANRDRYVNSILRSNSDIGVVLEEMYPDKVKSGGTSYIFSTSGDNTSYIDIYYVPQVSNNLLTEAEIEEFRNTRQAYYITDTINVQRGAQYTAIFNIDLELYQNSNVDSEVKDILDSYGEKFNINLRENLEEIKSLISKISNVKKIIEIDIVYTGEDGQTIENFEDKIVPNEEGITEIDLRTSYFQINYVINSIIQSSSNN